MCDETRQQLRKQRRAWPIVHGGHCGETIVSDDRPRPRQATFLVAADKSVLKTGVAVAVAVTLKPGRAFRTNGLGKHVPAVADCLSILVARRSPAFSGFGVAERWSDGSDRRAMSYAIAQRVTLKFAERRRRNV
jgi:hypothetical protein